MIDKQVFLTQLDELLELTPGSLKGQEKLDNLAAWDSLAVIGFIALVDENYGINVSPAGIRAAKTIDDLFALLKA